MKILFRKREKQKYNVFKRPYSLVILTSETFNSNHEAEKDELNAHLIRCYQSGFSQIGNLNGGNTYYSNV